MFPAGPREAWDQSVPRQLQALDRSVPAAPQQQAQDQSAPAGPQLQALDRGVIIVFTAGPQLP